MLQDSFGLPPPKTLRARGDYSKRRTSRVSDRAEGAGDLAGIHTMDISEITPRLCRDVVTPAGTRGSVYTRLFGLLALKTGPPRWVYGDWLCLHCDFRRCAQRL